MTPIAVAVITGLFTTLAAIVAVFAQRVRRDLDACLRDRRQLKQVLQLTVGALVGLLPDHQRDQLLVNVAGALESVDEAA
jgi:hypothetical protein